MNNSKVASSKRDRLPFAPIIEGGVAPKILKIDGLINLLDVDWVEETKPSTSKRFFRLRYR